MTEDPLLDIRQAASELSQALGREVKYNAMRTHADRGTFPFFKDPMSGHRVIRKSALLRAWQMAETHALMQPKKGRAA